MAKLGQIALIPSIEGKKRFYYNRNSISMALGVEWRQDLDDFLAELHAFSHNKAKLKVELWTIEDPDFDRFEIEVSWRPSGPMGIGRSGESMGMAVMDEAQFARAIGYRRG